MTAVEKTRSTVLFLCSRILAIFMVLLQVQMANCQRGSLMNEKLLPSTLPFCIDVPRNLSLGTVLKIKGTSEKTTKWLHLNLRRSCTTAERVLHVSIRYDEKAVVRTVFQNGNWGDEERGGPFPFSAGAPFVLLIEVQPYGYKVTGNGILLFTFAHQLPYSEVSALEMNTEPSGSGASIERIEKIDKTRKSEQGNIETIYPVPLAQPVYQPTIPFWGQFSGKLQVGQAIRIQGMFLGSLERFNIDLYEDYVKGPIILHLSIRFRFHGDVNTLVRNIYLNSEWKYEERGGPFPFQFRETFSVLIEVQRDGYRIELNDQYCCLFKHRLDFSRVKTMGINSYGGPMQIWTVELINNDKEGSSDTPGTTEILIYNESSICRSSVYIVVFFSFVYFLQ